MLFSSRKIFFFVIVTQLLKGMAYRLLHWGPIVALTIIIVLYLFSLLTVFVWFPPDNAVGIFNLILLCVWLYLILKNFLKAAFLGPGHLPYQWKPVIVFIWLIDCFIYLFFYWLIIYLFVTNRSVRMKIWKIWNCFSFRCFIFWQLKEYTIPHSHNIAATLNLKLCWSQEIKNNHIYIFCTVKKALVNCHVLINKNKNGSWMFVSSWPT